MAERNHGSDLWFVVYRGRTVNRFLLGVGFNREVAEDAALYWSKKPGSLARLIDRADTLSEAKIAACGERAKARIREAYTWEYIVEQYEELFLKEDR